MVASRRHSQCDLRSVCNVIAHWIRVRISETIIVIEPFPTKIEMNSKNPNPECVRIGAQIVDLCASLLHHQYYHVEISHTNWRHRIRRARMYALWKRCIDTNVCCTRPNGNEVNESSVWTMWENRWIQMTNSMGHQGAASIRANCAYNLIAESTSERWMCTLALAIIFCCTQFVYIFFSCPFCQEYLIRCRIEEIRVHLYRVPFCGAYVTSAHFA